MKIAAFSPRLLTRMALLCGFLLFCASAQAEQSADNDVVSSGVELLTLQKGDISFHLTPQERDEWYVWNGLQPPNEVSCEANVVYPRITTSFPTADKVNAILLKMAEETRCSAELSNAWQQVHVAVLSGSLFSFHINRIPYPRGGNGSCHGNWESGIYDLESGRTVTLSDLVPEKNIQALRDYVIDYWRNYGQDGIKVEDYEIGQLEKRLQEKPLGFPIFYEKGRIWMDVNEFMVGCAGGNSYPVELPARLIAETPENKQLFQ